MKKLISIIILLAAVLAVTSACMPKPVQTAGSPAPDVPEMSAVESEELAKLREENASLILQLEEANMKLAEQPTEDELAIINDLNNKKPVLPSKSEADGPLRFYPERTKLLNDGYVFAYAEDGHEISANMILRYDLSEDGTIEWESVLYDLGGGWEISD